MEDTMPQKTITARRTSKLALAGRRASRQVTTGLREGLLQDLIAVDIMVRTAHAQLAAVGASVPILGLAVATLDRDLEHMRSAIREIEAVVGAAA
jgi:hypothetical protein